MKIKRFHAVDVRQAIQEVRAVLGKDAVILSNTRVDGGVEIVAATDYDEKHFILICVFLINFLRMCKISLLDLLGAR